VQLGLASHDGENLSLDRCGSILDAINHVKAKQVEASVDFVAYEGRRLLDKALNLAVLLCDDNTVARRVLDLGHHNGALLAVTPVVFNELLKRIFADHVRVEDKEETRLVVLA